MCSSARVVTKASEVGALEWQNTHRAKANSKRELMRKERPEQIRVKPLCAYSHLTHDMSRDIQLQCKVLLSCADCDLKNASTMIHPSNELLHRNCTSAVIPIACGSCVSSKILVDMKPPSGCRHPSGCRSRTRCA